MSYSVLVNGVPVYCDSPDEALDLVMCVDMRRGGPEPPEQPPATAPQPAAGETTRHYRCVTCHHERSVTTTPGRHSKSLVCGKDGCQGECAPWQPAQPPVGPT